MRGLFHGFTATLAREMQGYFFFGGGYEASRALMTKPGQSKDDLGEVLLILYIMQCSIFTVTTCSAIILYANCTWSIGVRPGAVHTL